MEFEWDENKRQKNIAKHGLGFVLAEAFFAGRIIAESDIRKDYGEERYKAIGEAADQILVVIYTVRKQDVYRIISIRRARKDEQRAYRAIQERHEG